VAGALALVCGVFATGGAAEAEQPQRIGPFSDWQSRAKTTAVRSYTRRTTAYTHATRARVGGAPRLYSMNPNRPSKRPSVGGYARYNESPTRDPYTKYRFNRQLRQQAEHDIALDHVANPAEVDAATAVGEIDWYMNLTLDNQ